MTDQKHVYITKYALSSGGKPPHLPVNKEDEGFVLVRMKNALWDDCFRLGRDAFWTEAEAMVAIRAAAEKKIASLEKQITGLRQIVAAQMKEK